MCIEGWADINRDDCGFITGEKEKIPVESRPTLRIGEDNFLVRGKER